MKDAETLYGMALHEIFYIRAHISVMRVPGGWIYREYYEPSEGTDISVFVPYNNEFQRKDS